MITQFGGHSYLPFQCRHLSPPFKTTKPFVNIVALKINWHELLPYSSTFYTSQPVQFVCTDIGTEYFIVNDQINDQMTMENSRTRENLKVLQRVLSFSARLFALHKSWNFPSSLIDRLQRRIRFRHWHTYASKCHSSVEFIGNNLK